MSLKKLKSSKCYQHLRTLGKVIKGLLTTNTCLSRQAKSTTLRCVGLAKTLRFACNKLRLVARSKDVGGNDYESTQRKRRPCLRVRSQPPGAVGVCVLALANFPRTSGLGDTDLV